MSKQLKRDLIRVIKKHQADYWQLANVMKNVRQEIEKMDFYQKPKAEKRLPIMPSQSQINKFLQAFDEFKNPNYKLWALLIYTSGIRVGELVGILIRDVNLSEKKILIHGKGKKDRYVPVLPEICEMLKFYIKKDQVFLFENNGKPYSTRMVQHVFEKAKNKAGIEFRMSPHIARHVFLTSLTEAGWNEAEIMKISGHSDKNSLAIYQHLTVENIREKFNEVAGNQLRMAIV